MHMHMASMCNSKTIDNCCAKVVTSSCTNQHHTAHACAFDSEKIVGLSISSMLPLDSKEEDRFRFCAHSG